MFNRYLGRERLTPRLAVLVGLILAAGSQPALAKSRAIYIPEITIVPTVLQSDGVTPVSYNTKDGSTYWAPGLPISQGSVVKINAFVASGGADLATLIVRLDNTRIATLSSSPWSTTLDASTLSPGYHMIEVWAQAAGDKRQTNTKTLSFYISNTPVPQISVKGSLETLTPGQTPAYSSSETDETANRPPDFLSGTPVDASARVDLRGEGSDIDRQLISHSGAITLAAPIVVYCSRPTGSTAVRFAYSIVRDGQAIASPSAPLSLQYARIRIEPRTADRPGIRPGLVTLWVWGIDQDGQPSNPQRQDFVITGEGNL